MKLLPANMLSHRACATKAAVSAFTVVEMVVVSFILMWVVISLVALQIFALRIYTLAATKTTATQAGREALNKMRDGIRSANTAQVGTYNPTNGNGFIQVANGVAQIGNALQLVSYDINGNLTITNIYYLYQDTNSPSTNQLRNIDNNGVVDVLAKYVTNYYVFEAEDWQGNDLSNQAAYNNNGVVHITMQFYQWEYPIGFIGSDAVNAYDFYQLTTRVTRRCKQ
jgi:competence protein ComGC